MSIVAKQIENPCHFIAKKKVKDRTFHLDWWVFLERFSGKATGKLQPKFERGITVVCRGIRQDALGADFQRSMNVEAWPKL